MHGSFKKIRKSLLVFLLIFSVQTNLNSQTTIDNERLFINTIDKILQSRYFVNVFDKCKYKDSVVFKSESIFLLNLNTPFDQDSITRIRLKDYDLVVLDPNNIFFHNIGYYFSIRKFEQKSKSIEVAIHSIRNCDNCNDIPIIKCNIYIKRFRKHDKIIDKKSFCNMIE